MGAPPAAWLTAAAPPRTGGRRRRPPRAAPRAGGGRAAPHAVLPAGARGTERPRASSPGASGRDGGRDGLRMTPPQPRVESTHKRCPFLPMDFHRKYFSRLTFLPRHATRAVCTHTRQRDRRPSAGGRAHAYVSVRRYLSRWPMASRDTGHVALLLFAAAGCHSDESAVALGTSSIVRLCRRRARHDVGPTRQRRHCRVRQHLSARGQKVKGRQAGQLPQP